MDSFPVPFFPAIPQKQASSILKEVLCATKHINYDLEANEEIYRKADNESDPRFKQLILQQATSPDIEAKAIIAASVLFGIFENLGYGIYSNGTDIFIYNRLCWVVLDTNVTKHFVSDYLKKTGVKKIEAENANKIDRYTKQFVFSLYREVNKANRNEAKVNTNNCTVQIGRDGIVSPREHSKEDYFYHVLPYSFDAAAQAPRFQQFLNEVIPGDIQLVVQEFFGTCLVPGLKIEKVLIAVGEGHNGKSVLFNAVTYVYGKENVTTFNINSLCAEGSTTRIKLQNKLLNYSSDFSGKIWNNGFFKQLASGEPVEARSLYHDAVIIEDYAKLAYNSNSMPDSSDTSAGFRRRLMIVEFKRIIDKNKADPFLSEKLRAEAPGILNWMIEGLTRFLKNGNKFSQSKVLEATVNQYQASTDTVIMFMDHKGYKPGTSEKKLKAIHGEYQEFCKMNNHKSCLSLSDFKMRLQGIGYVIDQKNKQATTILINGPFGN